MTRFDADDPADRQLLFAEAIQAHRTRGSPYLTIEAEVDEENRDGADEEEDEEESAPEPAPWVQFADGVVNIDCTDAELDRLKELLNQFPAFTIEALNRPEDVEGTNVRISAKADAKRIAEFIERAFREVYEREAGYRAWVVEI